MGVSVKSYFVVRQDTLMDSLDKHSVAHPGLSLSHTPTSTQSAHPGSSDRKASPESSSVATDRSIPAMSCLLIESLRFCPHPPPPRKVPVILLKCASAHQPPPQNCPFHSNSKSPAQHMPRTSFPVFTWPTSTHLSFREASPVPPEQVKSLCSVLIRGAPARSPRPVLLACRPLAFCAQTAEHHMLWGVRGGQLAGKKASCGVNGQPSKLTEREQTQIRGRKTQTDRRPRPAESAGSRQPSVAPRIHPGPILVCDQINMHGCL